MSDASREKRRMCYGSVSGAFYCAMISNLTGITGFLSTTGMHCYAALGDVSISDERHDVYCLSVLILDFALSVSKVSLT